MDNYFSMSVQLFVIPFFGVIIGIRAENFRPLNISNEFHPGLRVLDPQCNFWISNQASETLKVDFVPHNLKHDGRNSLRIIGDYDVLKINCTATFPVDFVYVGVQPTEAIFVEWQKEIEPNKDPLYHQNYSVEVKIYSVRALFEYYNNPLNSYYEDANEGLPLTTMHDYSRTGNYSFAGIFNQSIGIWFYLFLEDSEQHSFLRNHLTVNMMITQNDKNLAIPCRTSHSESNVQGHGPDGLLAIENWNPVEGFVIPIWGKPSYGVYNCTIKMGNSSIADTILYNFAPGFKDSYFYVETQNDEVVILPETPPTSTGYTDFVYPQCRAKYPFLVVDAETAEMTSVPAANYGMMRLVQYFALPKFVNKSYTAKITRHSNSTEAFPLRQSNGVNLRIGTVYCSTEPGSEKIIDFGSSVMTGTVVPMGFAQDWVRIMDRQNTTINIHFGIRPLNLQQNKLLYTDSHVTFECRVNIVAVVKPIVWYLTMKNGTLVQDKIDYNLKSDTSINVIKIDQELKSIQCSASYWYSDFWRNISYEITPENTKTAIAPIIENMEEEYRFQLNSVNRNIPCVAHGVPIPEIYFEKDGKRMSEFNTITTGNCTILIFQRLGKSDEGVYSCIAKNIYITRKTFTVVLDDEGSGRTDSLIMIITIPSVVFIVVALAIVTSIYGRLFGNSKTGLTRREIQDFMKGLNVNQAEIIVQDENDYVQSNTFAQMMPYVKDYEVARNRFKIDESKVLGKGQFGLVLQGFVDDTIVAVKTVQRNADKHHLKALLSELKIMMYIGEHENVVQLIGACTKDLNRGFAYVFVKYLQLGDLQSFLVHNKPYFDPSLKTSGLFTPNSKAFGRLDLIMWSKQIASGMEFLASRNVIHGDLAARNVLLDENRTARLTDFGLSRRLYDSNDYIKKQQEPLPWRWLALESLRNLTFSKRSDVWAFGVTVWEILSLGEVPYPGYAWSMDFINDLENGLRMAKPKYGTDEQFVILKECWHAEPSMRPSIENLKTRFENMLKVENPAEPDAGILQNDESMAQSTSQQFYALNDYQFQNGANSLGTVDISNIQDDLDKQIRPNGQRYVHFSQLQM